MESQFAGGVLAEGSVDDTNVDGPYREISLARCALGPIARGRMDGLCGFIHDVLPPAVFEGFLGKCEYNMGGPRDWAPGAGADRRGGGGRRCTRLPRASAPDPTEYRHHARTKHPRQGLRGRQPGDLRGGNRRSGRDPRDRREPDLSRTHAARPRQPGRPDQPQGRAVRPEKASPSRIWQRIAAKNERVTRQSLGIQRGV